MRRGVHSSVHDWVSGVPLSAWVNDGRRRDYDQGPSAGKGPEGDAEGGGDGVAEGAAVGGGVRGSPAPRLRARAGSARDSASVRPSPVKGCWRSLAGQDAGAWGWRESTGGMAIRKPGEMAVRKAGG